MITLYGIKNCDSVKKARLWLAQNALDYTFHDFRAQGLAPALLDTWLHEIGWERLLNRRGTTWRELSEASKAEVDGNAARGLMLAHPTLIKRPVLALESVHLVGFADATYREFFSQHGKLTGTKQER